MSSVSRYERNSLNLKYFLRHLSLHIYICPFMSVFNAVYICMYVPKCLLG